MIVQFSLVCSNRTFMELKSPWGEGARVMGAGSNRTFMELKLRLCYRS